MFGIDVILEAAGIRPERIWGKKGEKKRKLSFNIDTFFFFFAIKASRKTP